MAAHALAVQRYFLRIDLRSRTKPVNDRTDRALVVVVGDADLPHIAGSLARTVDNDGVHATARECPVDRLAVKFLGHVHAGQHDDAGRFRTTREQVQVGLYFVTFPGNLHALYRVIDNVHEALEAPEKFGVVVLFEGMVILEYAVLRLDIVEDRLLVGKHCSALMTGIARSVRDGLLVLGPLAKRLRYLGVGFYVAGQFTIVVLIVDDAP